MVDPARLTSLKLRRCVVASAAILPSRLLLLVKLPSFVSSRPLAKANKKSPVKGGFFNGANRETRTPDPLITNQLLYQLSYVGTTGLFI